MDRFQKVKETAEDLGEVVKATVGGTLMMLTVPIGLGCTVATVVSRVRYNNYHHDINPNRPSPNIVDYPDGPNDWLSPYVGFCRKYILDKFFKDA